MLVMMQEKIKPRRVSSLFVHVNSNLFGHNDMESDVTMGIYCLRISK
jgi:hypothetical protein